MSSLLQEYAKQNARDPDANSGSGQSPRMTGADRGANGCPNTVALDVPLALAEAMRVHSAATAEATAAAARAAAVASAAEQLQRENSAAHVRLQHARRHLAEQVESWAQLCS